MSEDQHEQDKNLGDIKQAPHPLTKMENAIERAIQLLESSEELITDISASDLEHRANLLQLQEVMGYFQRLEILFECYYKNQIKPDDNRHLAGTTNKHKSWEGFDNRYDIDRHLLSALSVLSMKYSEDGFRQIFEKEKLVTHGKVIENINNEHKLKRQEDSAKGSLHSSNAYQLLSNHIKDQVITYCEANPDNKFIIKSIAYNIHDNIIKIILSNEILYKRYPVIKPNLKNEKKTNYQKIKTIMRIISELKKAGKLDKFLKKTSN